MRVVLAVILGCFTLATALLALAAAAAMPGAAAEYAQEPEDLWLLGFWLGVLLLLASAGAAALVRMYRKPKAPLGWAGTIVAIVVASLGIALAVLGLQEPLERGWAPAVGTIIAALASLFLVAEHRRAREDHDRAV